MFVGAYSLDLYCDNFDYSGQVHEYGEFPHQYVGRAWGEVARMARRDGWVINNKSGRCICPKCSKKNEVQS